MAGHDTTGDLSSARSIDDELVGEFVLAATETLAQLDAAIVALERNGETDRDLAIAARSLRTLGAGAAQLSLAHLAGLAEAGVVLVGVLRTDPGPIRPEPIEALWSLVDAARDLVAEVAESGCDDARHQRLEGELRRLATPTASDRAAVAEGQGTPPSAASTLRVERGLLDELAELADRLLLARNELAHHLRAGRSRTLDGVSADIDVLTTQIRSVVDRSRMESLGRAWIRLPRQARDLAHRHGKLVELDLEPDPPMTDQRVVERLRTPIASLVTWLVEAVIEPSDVRAADGRTPRATIGLHAAAGAERVTVSLTHDGPPEPPPVELVRAVEDMGARLDVEPHRSGTTMTLTMPTTGRRLDAVLVRCADQVFALPAAAVDETIRLDLRRARVEELAGAELLHDGERVLALLWLRDVLCFEPPVGDRHEIVVLHIDGERFGLVVDRVLPPEEVLTQTLPVPIERWGPFVSTTVCGSGEVATVLDVRGLVDSIGVSGAVRHRASDDEDPERRRGPVRLLAARIGDSTITIPTALVDDLATADEADFVVTADGTTVDDGRGPIRILALPDGPQPSAAGPRSVIVHERDGARFGIAVDEVLGEHHFPPPPRTDSAVIGIAASPVVGNRATDGIDIGRLIEQSAGRAADHG